MNEEFINEYTLNRKIIKEYVYNVLCKRQIYCGYILTIISIILSTINENMLIITLISLITTVLTPILTINQLEEMSKKLNNNKYELTKIIFSNKIIMDEGNNHLEFEYEQIKKIIETKKLIALKISNQSAILVLKEGFIQNDYQKFLEFIKIKENK